jgi:ABC-type transport system involved in cytochrome c biogenesis ATPase subunit
MTPPAVRTVGLSKSFGAVRALDQLTLEIPRGIIFGLLGPNGSGKTTTIRLLLGLLAPTCGYAEGLGYDSRVHAPAIRRRSGVLLEHCGLYERLTAADNLDLYGRFWRLPSRTRRARIEELLTRLGLWDGRGEIVACWSRGMKQTLAVAWKEWRELIGQRGLSGKQGIVLFSVTFGILLALTNGRAWITSPAIALAWSWVPMFLVMTVIADAFAGERERHTLETLLASRLSDGAILFGKMGAAIG